MGELEVRALISQPQSSGVTAILRPSRAGPPLRSCLWKNVPKIIRQKRLFPTKNPFFNEIFSKGRKFGILKVNWQKNAKNDK